MKFAIIPITALLIGLQFNSQPIDTPVSDNSLNVVSSFLTDQKPQFPDRTKQISEAQALDAQRLAEAQEAQRLALIAQQAKNVPQAPTTSVGGGTTDDKILKLKLCESGNNYAIRSNPKYRGAYQYDFSTWGNYGGFYDPADAPPEVQDAKFRETYARRGASPWPHCGRVAGL